jgi:hypothetical protein
LALGLTEGVGAGSAEGVGAALTGSATDVDVTLMLADAVAAAGTPPSDPPHPLIATIRKAEPLKIIHRRQRVADVMAKDSTGSPEMTGLRRRRIPNVLADFQQEIGVQPNLDVRRRNERQRLHKMPPCVQPRP